MKFLLVALLFSGCAHAAGYAGSHRAEISCKGKVALTGVGTLALGAGVGGASTNSFSLTGDCGEGFTYKQGAGASDVPGPAK